MQTPQRKTPGRELNLPPYCCRAAAPTTVAQCRLNRINFFIFSKNLKEKNITPKGTIASEEVQVEASSPDNIISGVCVFIDMFRLTDLRLVEDLLSEGSYQ